jgi:acyl-CoA dehydrogenase family protein 9
MTTLNYGRLALGAAASGLLEASFDDMLTRSKKRIQFEKPILEFELIQDKIVRAYVENEAIWAMTNFTAGLLEKDMLSYVAIESSHCKLYGTNRSWDTLYDAMQVAGGTGYLKSNPYEKRMRDARVATIFEGTTEIHSIYPPVSMLRNFAKHLFVKKKPLVSSFASLILLSLKPVALFSGSDTLIKKALSTVKNDSRLFKKMFIFSILKYGKHLPDKEFLLRRMTTISCQIFSIITMVLKIMKSGPDSPEAKKTHLALRYYLEQSRKIINENNSVKTNNTEAVHKVIVNTFKEQDKA